MRCILKNGRVELVGVDDGFSSSTNVVRRSVFEMHSKAMDEVKVRAPERAAMLASELGDAMKQSENRAVQVHDSLDPRKVFELLQMN